MSFFAEESISLPTDLTVKTLSRSKLYQNGLRAKRALVCNRSANAAVIVLFRFNNNPDATHALRILAGETQPIDGIENLESVKFRVLDGTGTGTIYVAYAS